MSSIVHSLVLMVGLIITLFTPVLVGHGLSVHSTSPIFLGVGCLLVGGTLLFASSKLGKSEGARTGH